MKSNDANETGTLDESVSYRRGFSFDFEDDGHNISVRCSSMTGKERVFLDGKLMAEKRSFRRKSSMGFMQGDNRYEVEFNVVNLLNGETHCTLIKNDVHVKTIKKALLKKNQLTGKNVWFKLPLYFAIGVAAGIYLPRYFLLVFGG